MKKFNKDGSDTKAWRAYKQNVLAAGVMIGNSPMAYVCAMRSLSPKSKTERMVS